MSWRNPLRAIGGLIAFAIAGIAIASAADSDPAEPAGPDPDVELLAGQGPIEIDNSRAGRAIVSAHDMAPGESVFGTVRVSVRGGPARVRLALRSLRSPPGPYGGRLADSLLVRIRKIGGVQRRLLFSGHPTELPPLKLGRWRGTTPHVYRMRVRFPGGAVPQNRLQGPRPASRSSGARSRPDP